MVIESSDDLDALAAEPSQLFGRIDVKGTNPFSAVEHQLDHTVMDQTQQILFGLDVVVVERPTPHPTASPSSATPVGPNPPFAKMRARMSNM